MQVPVFLSYPKPHLKTQDEFINRVKRYLSDRGLWARTLGVTDYDARTPLSAVRRMLLETNGLVTVAFRRTYVPMALVKPNADLEGQQAFKLSDMWLTSPWCQIEAAMAFQSGLPVLIFRESGVRADGILEKGVTGLYMPEFDLQVPLDEYFSSQEWRDILPQWEGWVRAVVECKGQPPKLF